MVEVGWVTCVGWGWLSNLCWLLWTVSCQNKRNKRLASFRNRKFQLERQPFERQPFGRQPFERQPFERHNKLSRSTNDQQTTTKNSIFIFIWLKSFCAIRFAPLVSASSWLILVGACCDLADVSGLSSGYTLMRLFITINEKVLGTLARDNIHVINYLGFEFFFTLNDDPEGKDVVEKLGDRSYRFRVHSVIEWASDDQKVRVRVECKQE